MGRKRRRCGRFAKMSLEPEPEKWVAWRRRCGRQDVSPTGLLVAGSTRFRFGVFQCGQRGEGDCEGHKTWIMGQGRLDGPREARCLHADSNGCREVNRWSPNESVA